MAVVAAGRTRISFGNGEEHVGREAGALEGEGVPLQAAVSAGGGAVTGVRPKSAVGEGRGQGMGSSPMEAPRRTAKSVRIGDDAMEATDPEMGRVHGDVAATGADGAGEGRRVRMVEVAAAPEKAGGLREGEWERERVVRCAESYRLVRLCDGKWRRVWEFGVRW